jgi:hypothetical protein
MHSRLQWKVEHVSTERSWFVGALRRPVLVRGRQLSSVVAAFDTALVPLYRNGISINSWHGERRRATRGLPLRCLGCRVRAEESPATPAGRDSSAREQARIPQ